MKALNEQLNTIDAHLISKQQIYNNFIQNRKEIIRKISLIDTLELNIPENMQMNDILHMLEEKEKEVISKKSILSETLNQFIAKETDKQNDIEVNKHLLDNKAKEIDMLETQKKELISMISNVSINNTKIAKTVDVCLTNKEKRLDTIISVVYLTLFSMAIPVIYPTWSAAPLNVFIYLAEYSTVLLLVPTFGLMLLYFFKNDGVSKFHVLPLIAMVILSSLTIGLRWVEEINIFAFIFVILTVICFIVRYKFYHLIVQ